MNYDDWTLQKSVNVYIFKVVLYCPREWEWGIGGAEGEMEEDSLALLRD